MRFRFYKSPRHRLQFALIALSVFSTQAKVFAMEEMVTAHAANDYGMGNRNLLSHLPYGVSKDSVPVKDTTKNSTPVQTVFSVPINRDTVNVNELKKTPYISLQQYLKGNIAGLYVQENNSEPGTIQSMVLRGASMPIFSNKDITAVQPTVYVNGLPLIQNHPFSNDVKLYDINPSGSASNMLAGLDLNNIISLEVIKDPVKLAQLGPLASNGVIWITTRDATERHKEKISLDLGYGMVAPPSKVQPTNGFYALDFRKQFYDAYNLPFGTKDLPSYLQDQRNTNYFGNANWPESFYDIGQQYKVNATVEGGGPIANFLFTLGSTRNSGISDNTSYGKNNLGFFMNMNPTKDLTVKAMIYGAMANRKRNKNMRDRYAEVEYLPDLSYPLPSGGEAYQSFLTLDKETLDQNKNNFINGYLKADYKKDGLSFGADLLFDYNIDMRHVFWPSTLMESISFISDYSGFNRRIVVDGYGAYVVPMTGGNHLAFKLTGGYTGDLHDYNYTRAFDGSSDQYKTTKSGAYRRYNYLDQEEGRLVTSSFNIDYGYKEILGVSALLRYDGYSKMQADNRWLFTPALSLKWNIKEHLLKESNISKLLFSTSWARVGKLIGYDRFSVGPYYTSSEMSWMGQSSIPSYALLATVTRPYKQGWSAYDISWPYTEKLNIDIESSFLKGQVDLGISFYSNKDKGMIIPLTVPLEYGYSYKYLGGMDVQNQGVDLKLAAQLLSGENGLSWRAEGNLNYNRNKLLALPEGRQELEIGNRKLQVGKAIDAFWVYENQGVYTSDEQVPVVGGTTLSYSKIPFKTGDAIWADINNDNKITEEDKVLKGHSLPKVTGGFSSKFVYGKWDLNFYLFFALGHKTLNERDANRYDFKTLDTENSLRSLQEIFFWQDTHDKYTYPIYNPASDINSYQADQDLFLQDLSYVKLRTVSLGYSWDFKQEDKKKKKQFKSLYIYAMANNLWTWTKFKGGDPELVGFNGYYTGYGQNIPLTGTLGVRYKF